MTSSKIDWTKPLRVVGTHERITRVTIADDTITVQGGGNVWLVFANGSACANAPFKDIENIPPAMTAWQPISTAPKDGTLVLAWSKDAIEPALVRFKDGYWRNNHYGPREPYFHYSELISWMLLPPPPETKT